MARRRQRQAQQAFGNLSFLDILANSIGAITFIFLMFFIIISGMISPSAFRIITKSLPDARAETPYELALAASGGIEPYQWRITTGDLPQNMSLDPKTGLISGSPAFEGTYRFTLEARDADKDNPQKTEQPLVIRVRKPSGRRVIDDMPLEISTGGMAAGTVGTRYNLTLAATGGEEPYFWSAVDSLPPGLALQNDRLVGTPIASGDWQFKLRVEDADKARTENEFQLSVAPRAVLTEDKLEPLEIMTKTLPNAVAKKDYHTALSAGGGVPPYTWSIVSGELPKGLILNPSLGVISGFPTRAGNAEVLLMVKDSQNSPRVSQRKFRVTVDPIFFEAAARNPLWSWWVIMLTTVLIAIAGAFGMALIIGVQCPWDRSWRCKPVGKDPGGHVIYTCRHGHVFINKPELIANEPAREEKA